MIVLPRQARDNHREKLEKRVRFLTARGSEAYQAVRWEEKTPFLEPFNFNVNNDLFAKTGSGQT